MLSLATACMQAQDAPGSMDGPMTHPAAAAPVQPAPAPSARPATPPVPLPAAPPAVPFDRSLFQKPFDPAQLAFLSQYNGAPAHDLWRDKQFRQLVKAIEPNCMFHYGRDMPLSDAMELVLENSRNPVEIHGGRYVLVPGDNGPILGGRGFLWFDMHDGIGLGAFYFHPTNGEPTPALNVFSRQVRDEPLSLGQMPPAFAYDLSQWALRSAIPPLTVRYFLTGANRKVLLEHDENFCTDENGMQLTAESGCEQEMADAADLDLTAAYYVDDTHHATNATAWMLSQDQVVFIQSRDRTCGAGPDPLGCRIRLTRERTRQVLRGPSGPIRPVHPVHT